MTGSSNALVDFVGIGVPRGATTWLHHLLRSHSEVYMPRRRKEVHFFDRYYERGMDWYSDFFPPRQGHADHVVRGEITPDYIYCELCPERISAAGIERLILSLRDPVDRLYSTYKYARRNGRYTEDFESYIRGRGKTVLKQGAYARFIRRYLQFFDPSQLLVLVCESATANVESTKRSLAEFLEIEETGFPPEAGSRPRNQSQPMRWPRIFGALREAGRWLRRKDADSVVNAANAAGIRGLFRTETEFREMDSRLRTDLWSYYEDDVAELEELLGVRLNAWGP